MPARTATAAVFLVVGTVAGAVAARLPAIKQDLSLSDLDLSIALLSLEAGAVLGLSAGGWVVSRWGNRGTLTWSLPLFGLLLVGLALAQNLAVLAAGTALFGAVNSVVDVAMNSAGVAMEVRTGRSMLSRLHAMHPIGGVAGAGLGALAATADVGHLAHFAVVGAAVVVVAAVAVPRLPVEEVPTRRARRGGLVWSAPLVAVGLLAFCLSFAEGGATNWSAVHLRESLGASPGLAAAAVTVFLLAMAAGRIDGDRLIGRFGQAAVFRTAVLVGGLGLGIGLLTDTVAGALVGFAFLGLGLSVTMPIAVSAAGRADTGTAAQAIATVSTMAYLGSFVSPAVIGAVAGLANLGVALGLASVLLLAMVPVAGVLTRTPRATARD